MPGVKFIISQPGHRKREIEFSGGVTSIGRAPDNTICLQGDANVSRYHSVIEARGDQLWLSDLGSANGTTVNGEQIRAERELKNGDRVCVGGTSVIEFRADASPNGSGAPGTTVTGAGAGGSAAASEAPAVSGVPQTAGASPSGLAASSAPAVAGAGTASSAAAAAAPAAAPAASGISPMYIALGAIVGLVLIGGAGVVLYSVLGGGSSATNKGPTTEPPVVTPSSNSGGDGSPVAGNGNASSDTGGGTAGGSDSGAGTNNSGTPTVSGTGTEGNTVSTSSGVDVRSLAEGLAGELTQKSGTSYVFDPMFVKLIDSHITEYKVSGYGASAKKYSGVINKAFGDEGLDPLFGYLLAMSRSRFNPAATATGAGLWQLPQALAKDSGYLGKDDPSVLSAPDQLRSAQVAAAYLKALIGALDGKDNFMYAIAVYGLPVDQAGQVRAQLDKVVPNPEDRRDFWKTLRLGAAAGVVTKEQNAQLQEGVDRVARFLAAGIVAENPAKFALKEQPLSQYKD